MDNISYFNDFIELSDLNKGECLQLSFQPSAVSVNQRWRNNGLSADFLADYATTFFPISEDDDASASTQKNIKHAVSYVANELLENGMKYSEDDLKMPMHINMVLADKTVYFNEINSVNLDKADNYLSFINNLQSNDPMDLFVEQLELQATGGESTGLGLLTMINDYQTELSWKFEKIEENKVTITTVVKLPL